MGYAICMPCIKIPFLATLKWLFLSLCEIDKSKKLSMIINGTCLCSSVNVISVRNQVYFVFFMSSIIQFTFMCSIISTRLLFEILTDAVWLHVTKHTTKFIVLDVVNSSIWFLRRWSSNALADFIWVGAIKNDINL